MYEEGFLYIVYNNECVVLQKISYFMQVDINVNFHQAEHLKIFSRKKFEEKKFVRFFFFVIDSKLQFYDLKKNPTRKLQRIYALNYIFLKSLILCHCTKNE